MSEKSFNAAFKPWKIWTAIALGILFAGFLIYRSLNETHFIEVKNKRGTHIWKDSNGNNKVDYALKAEFQVCKNGNYRQKSNSEFIQEITWTTSSSFWILLAVLCMFGRDLAYMWRIKILTNNHLTWRKSFSVIMLWEFASALSPGVVGGSAVAMFILNKEKIPLGKSTAIVIITAMMDNLFYIIMIPFVFIFISPADLFPSNSALESGIETVFWFGFTLIFVVCLFLFLSIFYFPSLIKNSFSLIFSIPFLKKWKNKALKTGDEIIHTSQEFKTQKNSFWLKSFGATLISWISRYLVINCILAAFISLGLYQHFFILAKQLVLWLFMLISPTPGASGVAEYAFSELMGSFSESLFLISTLAILWRLISYFPYLLIGAFVLPNWLKRKNQ